MAKGVAPFSGEAIAFLRELRENNAREWFQPRKAEFDALLGRPMLALCAAVGDAMRAFAVDHVVPPAKAMRRIYRDVRFSKDKSPYKAGLAALFPRAGLGKDGGAIYYFGISPDGVRVAAGLYAPATAELATLRADIVRDRAAFRRRTETPSLARTLGPLQGEQLVRVPKGFATDDPAVDLLRRKQFYFSTLVDVREATRATLAKQIVDRFRAATPFVDHVNGLLLAALRESADDARPRRPESMF